MLTLARGISIVEPGDYEYVDGGMQNFNFEPGDYENVDPGMWDLDF